MAGTSPSRNPKWGSVSLPVKYDLIPTYARRTVRERYIVLQNGHCCFCGNHLEGSPVATVATARYLALIFPKEFFIYPIHLHHDRKTGLTVGAVHAMCNAFMWQYLGE